MTLVLIALIVLLLCGGGYGYTRGGWNGPMPGVGGLIVILFIIFLIFRLVP